MVFFCLDVLDTLKLDTVHLVGTALGGWVATELATRLVPPVVADVYRAGLPEAELVRVADAAHAVWLEQPQHTAEIVMRFLQ